MQKHRPKMARGLAELEACRPTITAAIKELLLVKEALVACRGNDVLERGATDTARMLCVLPWIQRMRTSCILLELQSKESTQLELSQQSHSSEQILHELEYLTAALLT